MASRGIKDGYIEQTATVKSLVSSVANVKDGWTRSDNLETQQAQRVSNIYNKISVVVAKYGELAKKDVKEFNEMGLKIIRDDREDTK
jgi:hypothetical protein